MRVFKVKLSNGNEPLYVADSFDKAAEAATIGAPTRSVGFVPRTSEVKIEWITDLGDVTIVT